ncbi:hypothetical protein Btru_066110 [Bulinus truncatus]|nr:hypothetical protein Btru_066110 [Bulinus truncatus]
MEVVDKLIPLLAIFTAKWSFQTFTITSKSTSSSTGSHGPYPHDLILYTSQYLSSIGDIGQCENDPLDIGQCESGPLDIGQCESGPLDIGQCENDLLDIAHDAWTKRIAYDAWSKCIVYDAWTESIAYDAWSKRIVHDARTKFIAHD